MAKANIILIGAIRNTARNLEKSDNYQWGHMGRCNCGYLAQELTDLSNNEIHRRAMEKSGDWSEQLNDYCPASGLLMDDLITQLLSSGLDADDLRHLEKLSDPDVLRTIPGYQNGLSHNLKSDVIRYMKAWAAVLASDLSENIELPQFSQAVLEEH